MALMKTPAITLKSRRWGEADRIVTFYSLRFGKLRAVARGARRMKSRFGSALEPFVHCNLNLFEKPGDSLYRVTQADIRQPFTGLREDLARMGGAARMVNLVSAVTREGDAEPRLYETLLEGLRCLHDGADPDLIPLLFQIRLLADTGFRPQTDHCTLCGKVESMEAAMFLPRSGGLVCGACASRQPSPSLRLSRGAWAALRQASRMAPSLLVRLRLTGSIREELEAATESFVQVVTGTRLPPLDFLAADSPGPTSGTIR